MTKGLRHWQHCLLSSCLDNINDPLPISLYSSSPDPSSLLVHSHRPLSQVTSTTMETAKHNNPTPKPHIPIYSLRVRAISPQTLGHSVSSLGVHTLACFFILPLGLENGHRCVSLLYPVQITLCVGQGKGNPQITSMFTVTEKRMRTSSSGIILIILEFLCVFWVLFFFIWAKVTMRCWGSLFGTRRYMMHCRELTLSHLHGLYSTLPQKGCKAKSKPRVLRKYRPFVFVLVSISQ